METRTTVEVKIYKLLLNDMRNHAERHNMVAIAYERDKLIQWCEKQRAQEVYIKEGMPSFACHGDSHKWHKAFLEYSPLEWYNPCNTDYEPDCWGHGIHEEWTTEKDIIAYTQQTGIPLIQ